MSLRVSIAGIPHSSVLSSPDIEKKSAWVVAMEPPQKQHVPVMREAVVNLLSCRPGGCYVDGTLGGGGYAQAILEASAPDGVLLALDWDADAIVRVREELRAYGQRLLIEKASFGQMPQVLKKRGWNQVDGIVLDLGVSSYQLDDPHRGFSFIHDGPLDMRMDREGDLTAADLVNSLPEEELSRLIFQLGEERWARRIAHAIVTSRKETPFSRTHQLAKLIEEVVPKSRDTRRIHPATRSFQALRLAVNRELEALRDFLSHVLDVLKPGGRLCILAFHSLEDRLVKEHFKQWAKACRCSERVLQCQCEGKSLVRVITKKVLRPDQEEIERNPRSRSARLRVVEKCV